MGVGAIAAMGTLPQWGAFLVLIGILVRQVVPWRRLSIDSAAQLRKELEERNSKLIARVEKCEKECEDHKTELRTQIHALEQQRLDDRAQNLQEQISLVSILVKNVDNPLLAQVLESLQGARRKLPHELTGVVGDAKTTR